MSTNFTSKEISSSVAKPSAPLKVMYERTLITTAHVRCVPRFSLCLKQQLSCERTAKVETQVIEEKNCGACLLEKAKATSGNISL
jgi:hypothetical protein